MRLGITRHDYLFMIVVMIIEFQAGKVDDLVTSRRQKVFSTLGIPAFVTA